MKLNPHRISSEVAFVKKVSHAVGSINSYSAQLSELLYLLNEEKELDDDSRISIEKSLSDLTSYIPTTNYDFNYNEILISRNETPVYYPNEHLSKILIENYDQLYKFTSSYFNLTLSSHLTKFLVELIYNLQYWEIYHLLYIIPDLNYFLKLVDIEVNPTPYGAIVKPPVNYLEFSMSQGFQYPFPYPFYNYSYHSLDPDVTKRKFSKISIKPYIDITLKNTLSSNRKTNNNKKRGSDSSLTPNSKKRMTTKPAKKLSKVSEALMDGDDDDDDMVDDDDDDLHNSFDNNGELSSSEISRVQLEAYKKQYAKHYEEQLQHHLKQYQFQLQKEQSLKEDENLSTPPQDQVNESPKPKSSQSQSQAQFQSQPQSRSQSQSSQSQLPSYTQLNPISQSHSPSPIPGPVAGPVSVPVSSSLASYKESSVTQSPVPIPQHSIITQSNPQGEQSATTPIPSEFKKPIEDLVKTQPPSHNTSVQYEDVIKQETVTPDFMPMNKEASNALTSNQQSENSNIINNNVNNFNNEYGKSIERTEYSGISSSSSSSSEEGDGEEENENSQKTNKNSAMKKIDKRSNKKTKDEQQNLSKTDQHYNEITFIRSEHERVLEDDQSKKIKPKSGVIHQCHLSDPQSGNPCLKIFYGKNELLRHQEFVHATKKKIYKCIYCSRCPNTKIQSYPRHDSLARHIRRKHGVTGKENKLAVNYAKENVEIIDERQGNMSGSLNDSIIQQPLPHPQYLNPDFTIKSSYAGFLSFSTRDNLYHNNSNSKNYSFGKDGERFENFDQSQGQSQIKSQVSGQSQVPPQVPVQSQVPQLLSGQSQVPPQGQSPQSQQAQQAQVQAQQLQVQPQINPQVQPQAKPISNPQSPNPIYATQGNELGTKMYASLNVDPTIGNKHQSSIEFESKNESTPHKDFPQSSSTINNDFTIKEYSPYNNTHDKYSNGFNKPDGSALKNTFQKFRLPGLNSPTKLNFGAGLNSNPNMNPNINSSPSYNPQSNPNANPLPNPNPNPNPNSYSSPTFNVNTNTHQASNSNINPNLSSNYGSNSYTPNSGSGLDKNSNLPVIPPIRSTIKEEEQVKPKTDFKANDSSTKPNW